MHGGSPWGDGNDFSSTCAQGRIAQEVDREAKANGLDLLATAVTLLLWRVAAETVPHREGPAVPIR
jgi:hypothetical protein